MPALPDDLRDVLPPQTIAVAQLRAHLAAQDILLTRIAEQTGTSPVPVIDVPAGASEPSPPTVA